MHLAGLPEIGVVLVFPLLFLGWAEPCNFPWAQTQLDEIQCGEENWNSRSFICPPWRWGSCCSKAKAAADLQPPASRQSCSRECELSASFPGGKRVEFNHSEDHRTLPITTFVIHNKGW